MAGTTNYANEFSKLFAGGVCSVKKTDWNAPRYFDTENNDCYKSEAALVSSLTSEAYGNFGFTVQYYVKNIDIKIDRLMGEDPLENIERRFTLQMYVDNIPSLQKSYELQGMVYTEIITCQCSIQHFWEASQLSYPDLQSIYQPIVPRIGDIVYIEYSDLYYEVVNVKEFADGSTFLSTPITYTFSLRVWRNNHEDVDVHHENSDPMEEIRHYAELAETFNLDAESTDRCHTSEVAPESDMLSKNTYLKQDVDKNGVPKDNVNSHVVYQSTETKTDNPAYVDPFDGW